MAARKTVGHVHHTKISKPEKVPTLPPSLAFRVLLSEMVTLGDVQAAAAAFHQSVSVPGAAITYPPTLQIQRREPLSLQERTLCFVRRMIAERGLEAVDQTNSAVSGTIMAMASDVFIQRATFSYKFPLQKQGRNNNVYGDEFADRIHINVWAPEWEERAGINFLPEHAMLIDRAMEWMRAALGGEPYPVNAPSSFYRP